MKRIARFEHPTNARYYEIYFGQDLFGHLCITTIWGRKNTELGKIHRSYPESLEKAQQQFKRIQRQREKRQYHVKESIDLSCWQRDNE